ncbi:MAG: hypothetical protein HY560_06170 [Gemmatimonadetes bacterium]|nr:hypothetical protein [Gemmatimonadota bacterium]
MQHQQVSGQPIRLVGTPLADTVGEPVVGEIRIDSVRRRDTTTATTNFEGYMITVQGVVSPSSLRELLGRLVSQQN